MSSRPQKIAFAEMRKAGVTGVLVYCSDHKCSHWRRLSADRWPDHLRLSDIEPRFVCEACGLRGADVRPDWDTVTLDLPRRILESGS
jgi:hypothetical protein